jgi:gluconate kinase
MPVTLLDSQLATLEPLHDDEPGVAVDIAQDVPHVLAEAIDGIRLLTARARSAG